MQESLDCFGRYHESTAPECRICLDNVKCRHAMKGKRIMTNDGQSSTIKEQNTMASVKIAPEVIEATLTELNAQFEKKQSGPTKTVYRVSSEKHKKYLDIASTPRGVKIFSKFAIEGAKVDEKDPRPYSVSIESEEKFFEIVNSAVSLANAPTA